MLKLIREIIADSVFGSILAVVLTALLTYTFTQMANKKIKYLDVYSIQLKKIFLPLYLCVVNKKIKDIDKKLFYKNLITKKRQMYLYVPDNLSRIIERLERQIENENVSDHTIKLCKDYIEYKYFKLRNILGYSDRKFSVVKHNFFRTYNIIKICGYINISVQAIILAIVMIAEVAVYYNDFFELLTIIFAISAMINLVITILYIYFTIYWIIGLYC